MNEKNLPDHISKEELFRIGAESSLSQIILTDPEGVILYANLSAERLTGYSRSEIIGQTPRLWGGLMGREFYANLWNTIKHDRKAFDGRVTNRRKNGEKYIANVHIAPFLLRNGDIGGFVSTEEDVTDLVHAEEEATLLADIVRSSRDAIVRVDLEGVVVSWNPAAEQMFKYKAEEVVGKVIFNEIGGSREEEMKEDLDLVKKGESVDSLHSVRQAKDGSPVNVLISFWPIYDINNVVVGASVLYHDVSHEDALRLLESQFITIAAHQLRTPLTGIRWVSERFLKTEKLNDQEREYLKDIGDSTERLIKLVNVLLNASRIQEGAVAIVPVPTDAVGFVSDYLKEYKPVIASKKQKLKFVAAQRQIDVEIDQNAFRNIVQSLVSNAVEYTPEKGTITVRLKKTKEKLVLSVMDTGIGIPAAARGFMFEKFFRAENAKRFKTDGTGLGLYIASQAVKLLGGNIGFTSRVGQGTTFTVTIPLIVREVRANKSFV